jgi:hypothetical protein
MRNRFVGFEPRQLALPVSLELDAFRIVALPGSLWVVDTHGENYSNSPAYQ